MDKVISYAFNPDISYIVKLEQVASQIPSNKLIFQLVLSVVLFGATSTILMFTVNHWVMEALGSISKLNDLPCRLQKEYQASAVLYSLVKTAKIHNLKKYEYLKHRLTGIPNHMDDTDRNFLDGLFPWASALPKNAGRNEYTCTAAI